MTTHTNHGPLLPQLERDLIAAVPHAPARRAPTWRRGRSVAAGVAVSAAAVAAAISFAAGSSDDQSASAGRVPRVIDALSAQFSVLNREPTAADQAPYEENSHLPGIRTTTRHLPDRGDGAQLWAARGAGGQMCLLAHTPIAATAVGGTCVRQEQAISDGVFLEQRADPQRLAASGRASTTTEIAALVPNGVTSVSFTLANGELLSADTSDNGVYVSSAQPIRTARFVDGRGQKHTVRLTAP